MKRATKKKRAARMVKIMGYTVREGTKRHAALVQQKKIFDQNFAGEHGAGRAKNPRERKRAKKRAKNSTRGASNMGIVRKVKSGRGASNMGIVRKIGQFAPAPKKRNPRRRNSEDSAAAGEAKALYKSFHQTGSHRHRDVTTPIAVPVHLAELGRLIELNVAAPKGNFVLKPKGVTLTSTPDGKQMYFVGGDQVPPLAAMGVDGSKVHVCLGALKKIVYLTRKGFHNFADVEYVHRMGQEGGIAPTLNYDTQSKLLYLVGGTYRVKPAGITN